MKNYSWDVGLARILRTVAQGFATGRAPTCRRHVVSTSFLLFRDKVGCGELRTTRVKRKTANRAEAQPVRKKREAENCTAEL